MAKTMANAFSDSWRNQTVHADGRNRYRLTVSSVNHEAKSIGCPMRENAISLAGLKVVAKKIAEQLKHPYDHLLVRPQLACFNSTSRKMVLNLTNRLFQRAMYNDKTLKSLE